MHVPSQQKEEVNVIMEEIKRELNLGQGQEPEIIWLLWQQNEEFSKNVKELEMGLDVLRVDYGSITKGLQVNQNRICWISSLLVFGKFACVIVHIFVIYLY